MNKSSDSEVLQTARAWNFDAYLAATLAPAGLQVDLIAIAAFVGELERIRQTLTEPSLAGIRIQWWRDELQFMAGSGAVERKPEHPVGRALARAVKRHDLPVGRLVNIADAVTDQVEGRPLSKERALDAWVGKRFATPFDLAARCLGAADHEVVPDAGHAYGLATLLCSEASLSDPTTQSRIATSRTDLAAEASAALLQTAPVLKSMKRADCIAFLPLALTRLYLGAGAGAGTTSNGPPRFRKVLRMASAHWFGRW